MKENIKISIRNSYFEEYVESIKDWSISQDDKDSLLLFIKDYQLGKITGNQPKDDTIKSALCYIKTGLEFFNKPSTKLEQKDIERFSEAILKDELKKDIGRWNDKHKYVPFAEVGKIKLKTFTKTYLDWKLKDKSEKLTKTLVLKPRLKERTPDYLREESISLLYKNCLNAEQRFIIAVLFDSGARAEEFHNIRIEDIELPTEKDTFVRLTLKEEYSKTKGRVISLYWKHSLDAVRDYLDERIKEGATYSDPIMKKHYGGVRGFLARLGKKAIGRHVHFHLFRHSSATYYADKMNRQQLCIRYGWRFSSPMPDRYINRNGIQQEELTKQFESTKFEDLKDTLEKQSRENSVLKEKQEILEAELQKRMKFDPLLNKLMNHPKLQELMIEIA